jgi:hypothetical protein
MSDNAKQPPQPTSPPNPEQQTVTPKEEGDINKSKKSTNPTRYGDWEKSGRCIDF